MSARVWEGHAEYRIVRRLPERPELAAIGKEIMQREHRNSVRGTARLVAQSMLTAPREPRDSRSPGRLWTDMTSPQAQGNVGSPANGEDSATGRTARRVVRARTTSQTTPATRPPQTAFTISTGKR